MKELPALCVGVALSLFVSAPLWADDDVDSRAAFSQGVALMQKREFREAIPQLKKAETAYPTDPAVLWNLGIASAEIGSHSEALSYWQKYRRADPEDWKAIPKVIQAEQALGDLEARDRELQELRDLRASSRDPDLTKADKFCREQFTVDGERIFAFEYFDPRGERRMFYRFSIVDLESDSERSFISLGSYDATTQIARELGEITENQRAYHVDRYARDVKQSLDVHQTFAHFNEKPTYEVVRKLVVDIVHGDAKPLSESRHRTAPGR